MSPSVAVVSTFMARTMIVGRDFWLTFLNFSLEGTLVFLNTVFVRLYPLSWLLQPRDTLTI